MIDFNKTGGLIPAIVQHYITGRVLMLGYMNEEALRISHSEGKVTFFSRSKGRLWTKGEESGNFLLLKSVHIDCDRDTILIKADPQGPVCHTGSETCFSDEAATGYLFLDVLEKTIRQRQEQGGEGSYTAELFSKGINKIAQKVGEEAVELVIEAKDDNRELFVGEAADLLYHYLVLLRAKDVGLSEVLNILEKRRS
jgi:phosphoribosyl-ATP pyrophosphohydrolase/phosphoribosyl-AMP cyclohydrolase